MEKGIAFIFPDQMEDFLSFALCSPSVKTFIALLPLIENDTKFSGVTW